MACAFAQPVQESQQSDQYLWCLKLAVRISHPTVTGGHAQPKISFNQQGSQNAVLKISEVDLTTKLLCL